MADNTPLLVGLKGVVVIPRTELDLEKKEEFMQKEGKLGNVTKAEFR